MAERDELVQIQQAHHRRYLGAQNTAGDLMGETWDAYANLDDVAAAEFEAAADVVSAATRQQTTTLAVAYMNANDRAGGFPGADLVTIPPQIRGGVAPVEVYHRSIVEARTRIAEGASYTDAMAAGRSRAVSTAKTDVLLTNRATVSRAGPRRPWVVGYRRVLTGKSCGFCALISTQRYTRGDLMPVHPSCDCDVAEIFGTADPGRVVNRELLDELKSEGAGSTDTARNYVVDEQGTIRRRTLDPDKPGAKLDADVVEHGELGATIRSASTAPPAPAPPPTPAPELARRTRSTVNDPDVLAEARRRNVTPERVVEIREEKASRRFLEDRARREATKNLAADSPDVLRAAERYGVSPDEVMSARARVADVRKVAREEAAKVQADALRELDRMDAVRMRNPPRLGARTDTGTAARRGEYDWLEQVSDREKARLSRQWYGGTQAPDQLAANMSNALGRELSTDEAMQLWLDLNRRAEAAGALRRGKLPSADAYSGAIDADELLAELTDQGYDLARLFGDDLDAAGHIASVERELVQREALDYLGDAVTAVEGPSPYRMSFQSWEEEVRDLEYAMREGLADDVGRRRYAELVPEYLDEPGLDFEDLYARIVSTARKAGEEVPEHASIPWR